MSIRNLLRILVLLQVLKGAANFRPINIDQALNREFVCGKQAKRTDRLPCAGLWIQFILDLSRFKAHSANILTNITFI